ncbi:hypothetical protein KR067_003230, partial [Drosophila pandora]
FKFTNFVCDLLDPSWVEIYQCRLKAIRRDKTTLNFNGTLLKTMKKFKLHVQIFKKANGWKPWLYNITFDGCRFIRNPNVPVAALVFNLFKDNSNFNHSCPYSGPVYILNLHVTAEDIPVPLPSGDYLLLIKWYFASSRNLTTSLVISSGIYFNFKED